MKRQAKRQWERGVVGAVVAEILEVVVPGREGGFLPGVRILAETLGVSVPTVCKALRQLADEGVLTSGGTRRRWRVVKQLPAMHSMAARRSESGGTARTRRLLFTSSQQLNVERFAGVEVFGLLMDKMAGSGWEVIFRVLDFQNARKPRRAWDEMLELIQPDAMVAIGGTEILGKWALERKIPTLFVGGTPGESGIPTFFTSVQSMLKDAVERLFKLGHRRVLFPLCARLPEFVTKVRAVEESLVSAGIPRGCLTIVSSDYKGPDVIVSMLRRQWRERAPDALIFLDWREFVAAESFLHSMGIAIPRDVSVIVLSHNVTMEWHLPPISHYEHPVAPIARAVAKWVKTGWFSRNPSNMREFKAGWVSRESVLARQAPPGDRGSPPLSGGR